MAAKRKKKQREQTLRVNGRRQGEIRYYTAYTAQEAARKAVAMARDGWLTDVTATSGHLKMRCVPVKRGRNRNYDKPGAHCTIKPAFKKQIKGLAGR